MLSHRGFTLIELLVVIAIIGMLSAVTLASLGVARQKGADAAIMANMATIQTQMEILYSQSSNYSDQPIASLKCLADPQNLGDSKVKLALAAIANANSSSLVGQDYTKIKCLTTVNPPNDLDSYAISAQMVKNPAQFWCIDSAGFSGLVDRALKIDDWVAASDPVKCPG